MATLHIVTTQIGGYAREDASRTSVVGAYTDPAVANTVRLVSGVEATVAAVEVDHIPPGLLQTMKELGLKVFARQPA